MACVLSSEHKKGLCRPINYRPCTDSYDAEKTALLITDSLGQCFNLSYNFNYSNNNLNIPDYCTNSANRLEEVKDTLNPKLNRIHQQKNILIRSSHCSYNCSKIYMIANSYLKHAIKFIMCIWKHQ